MFFSKDCFQYLYWSYRHVYIGFFWSFFRCPCNWVIFSTLFPSCLCISREDKATPKRSIKNGSWSVYVYVCALFFFLFFRSFFIRWDADLVSSSEKIDYTRTHPSTIHLLIDGDPHALFFLSNLIVMHLYGIFLDC